MTNLEHIRAMSAAEMAEAIYNNDDIASEICLKVCGGGGDCPYEPVTEKKCCACVENWLNTEVQM